MRTAYFAIRQSGQFYSLGFTKSSTVLSACCRKNCRKNCTKIMDFFSIRIVGVFRFTKTLETPLRLSGHKTYLVEVIQVV